MSEAYPDKIALPPRKVVFSLYSGPKKGLGTATQQVYAWVGTYFQDRIGDVTVCFSDLSVAEGGPETPIDAEVRFEVDEHFHKHTKLPDGLHFKKVPPETLLLHTYEGPITALKDDVVPWLKKTAQEHKVKPGYQQRIVRMAREPTSPDWEVEVALVLDER